MEGFLALFAVASIGWYVTTALFGLLWFWAIFDDKPNPIGGVVLLVFYGLFLTFIARAGIFGSLTSYPLHWLAGIAGYFLIGLIWSIVKWYLNVHELAELYKDARKSWLKRILVAKEGEKMIASTPQDICGLHTETYQTRYNVTNLGGIIKKLKDTELRAKDVTTDTPIPEAIADYWEHDIPWGVRKPKAAENKQRITTWIVHWPPSLLWSLLHDFVEKLVSRIVMSLRKVFDGIANSAYK